MAVPWRSVLALAAVSLVSCANEAKPQAIARLAIPRVPRVAAASAPTPTSVTIAPLTPELRAKGFTECNPHDPLGLGPYAPFRPVPFGKILIPKKGGHTADMGFDVVIHFHGADAVRKYLVQSARGVVLVLVDKGLGGGGPYTQALGTPQAFPLLRRGIEQALRSHTGSEQAHVRHLAVSAWSAGTEAVRKLLEQNQPGIDAVIVLDGLHGAWKQGAPRVQSPDSLDARFIRREIALAERARKGEIVFVLTHSRVDPMSFPSTGTTAALLLRELGLAAAPVASAAGAFGQLSSVDERGLHVWGYGGKEELGHCAQLCVMTRIVSELLEPAWGTPAMDRSGPPTPHPDWAFRKR